MSELPDSNLVASHIVSDGFGIINALSNYSEDQIQVDLKVYPIEIELFNLINPSVLEKYQLIPLLVNQDYLIFASHFDNNNDEIKSIIQLETGFKPIFINAEEIEIQRVLQFYLGSEEKDINLHSQQTENTQENENQIDEKTAVKKVNALLRNAIHLKASDIHIFPTKQNYLIQFRIDGLLHKMQSISIAVASSIIARIKIIANLNITEKQLPQDGNISFPVQTGRIDFRVSLIPTIDGDSLAIRVLDSIENIKEISKIGYDLPSVEKIKNMLTDSGIVLVTGQTGSGKSTTIYALINELIEHNLNIITIEDPVEYKLSGIRQIQIHEQIGYDFPTALRSILRHDPDVIVIGEIRDQKTAQIAIQSALTGHLVISTLHTKSAIGSITRLVEIGNKGYLLASVLKGVISQKLVRKICPSCLGNDGRGCAQCSHSGYLGRCPIYEVLPVSKKIASLIASGSNEEIIYEQAKEEGFELIIENAKKLVEAKITTQEEINRRLNSFE